MAAPNENRSRSALRSTLAKGVPLRAGFCLGNCYGDESQGQCLFIRDAPEGGWEFVLINASGRCVRFRRTSRHRKATLDRSKMILIGHAIEMAKLSLLTHPTHSRNAEGIVEVSSSIRIRRIVYFCAFARRRGVRSCNYPTSFRCLTL
jgi:hypothetical protein